jgi:alpha-beta hydrolase superfamily lysophospholipase
VSSLFDTAAFNRSLFFPRPDVTRCPAGARDLRVDVAPGVSLHLRLHPARNARAVVLLFHGNGEVVASYDALARDYARLGAALAVVDFRGYGASGGAPTLRACLADAHAALAAARAHAGGLPVVVMGRSLGSACAAELCRDAPASSPGFVFESGIADLAGMVRRRGLDPAGALSADDLATFDPLPKFARCEARALVLHGAEDALIPASEARLTYATLKSADKTLVLVPDRGHNDLAMGFDYWEGLDRFLAPLG